jgi:hypothetical protein
MKTLKRGEVYYLLTFYDSELTVPSIQTVFYVGDYRDLGTRADRGQHFFQTAESRCNDGAVTNVTQGTPDTLFALDDDSLHDVLTLEELLQRLAALGT